MAEPTRVRGKLYASRTQVAHTFGCSVSHVSKAAWSGTLDWIGLEKPPAPHPSNKPVRYNGKTYPSQTALAKELGLNRSVVSKAVKRGRLEWLGKGEHQLGIPRKRRGGYEVEVEGVTYRSVLAAHRATGMSRDKLMRIMWKQKGTEAPSE